MSASKATKRRWGYMKSIIPFVGHKKRTNKVTTIDANALQDENTAGLYEYREQNNTTEERQKLKSDDSDEQEDINARHDDCEDGSQLVTGENEQTIGKDSANMLEDETRRQKGEGATNESDEEGTEGKRNATKETSDSPHVLPEEEEACVTKTNGSEVHPKHKSFAEVGKTVQRKIVTVNSFASKGRNENSENLSKEAQKEVQSELSNTQRRGSATQQQGRADKARKDRQNKAGQDRQWKNVKNVYTVTIKHGNQSEYEKPESAKYDEQERKRQAELLFWKLDMEDIMLRLRRINRNLDAHLRRLTENKKSGK